MHPLPTQDLLADLPLQTQPEESFSTLWASGQLRIERIVSTGQASPPGFWYDQPTAEWVLLLKGAAGLWLEGEPEPRCLQPGQAVLLPAACRHRVEWTAPDEPTVWLAVHFSAGEV
ncbi:MAG: cupin domain-containing protein [Zoogloea sp.]|uniref:cupin domain-containing protein n=1 Tax=Zoogloea sp. TaxID=49181 RepID=UPI003F351115